MNPKMRKTLELAVENAVKRLKDKGLMTLYSAGNEDTTKYSDIDLIGIVSPEFDIEKEEKEINAHYEKERKKTYNGIEVRFRGIGVDELNGGNPRGVFGKYIGLDLVLKQFPFYEHVWGDKIDFSKFKVKPATPKEEARRYIVKIDDYLDCLESGKEKFPIQNFPKQILFLAAVEAQQDYGFEYHPSYKRLASHLSGHKEHIVHDMMKLRRKKVTKKDILSLSDKIKGYTEHMKKRAEEY
jgi:hypothetical protein